MTKPVDVTDNDWESEVLGAAEPVFVDFWAPWCGPCRMVAPLVDELAGEYDGKVKFLKLNADDNMQTMSRYGVRSIPTMMVFKDGKPVDQVIGFRPKSELKKTIERALS